MSEHDKQEERVSATTDAGFETQIGLIPSTPPADAGATEEDVMFLAERFAFIEWNGRHTLNTCMESGRSRMIAMARKAFEIIRPPAAAGEARVTFDRLSQLLMKHGIVDECAIYDSEGYDGGRKRDAIHRVAAALSATDAAHAEKDSSLRRLKAIVEEARIAIIETFDHYTDCPMCHADDHDEKGHKPTCYLKNALTSIQSLSAAVKSSEE